MEKEWVSVSAANLVRRADSGIYYLQAKVGGKKVRRSLRTDKLRIAKLKRDDLLAELRAAVGGGGAASGPVSLAELVALTRRYYLSLPNYQRKPRTLKYRVELLEVIFRTLRVEPAKWSAVVLRAWWSSEGIVKYSSNRRNNLLGTLKKMIEVLEEQGVRLDDPARTLRRARMIHKEVWVPNKEEFSAVVEELRRPKGGGWMMDSADMVEFMAFSGCRPGEAGAVRCCDIGDSFIKITGGEDGTKNSLVRYVPIVPAMREWIEVRGMGGRRMEDYLFSIKTPERALRAACKKIGVEHMSPKTCRHYFATTCIESGIDIPTVAKWMGHKDGGALAMRVYGHLRDEHSKEAALKVDF